MAAYQAGNQAAFGELFDRYAHGVYGFLARRLGDQALAEDIYQEAFLRLHLARRSYDPSRPFRAWLFSIVHNLLNDVLRRRQRAPQVECHEALTNQSGRKEIDGPDNYPTDERSPERLALARESSRMLERVLASLPADEATVLILARLEGLPYEEIGTILGRSAAATKQLAYRALKRVRTELAAAGHQGEPS